MAIEFHRNPGFDERRRANRTKANLEIAARERGRSALTTRIGDFTRHGCRMAGYGFILEGAPMWIKLPGLESLAGRIVWTDGLQAGIVFDQPLHPAVAARFQPQGGELHGYEPGDEIPHVTLPANDDLLTRREQIMQGIAGSDISPLVRRKPKSELGIAGMIDRQIARQTNYRFEVRYTDAVNLDEGVLKVAGKPARVGNVSSSGLMVHAEIDAEIGDMVSVEFAGFEPYDGRLVWIRDGEAGISLPPQTIELCDR